MFERGRRSPFNSPTGHSPRHLVSDSSELPRIIKKYIILVEKARNNAVDNHVRAINFLDALNIFVHRLESALPRVVFQPARETLSVAY